MMSLSRAIPKDVVMHCGQEMITHQVLVQPAGKGVKPVDNVVELVGKDVYVEKDRNMKTV